MPSLLVIGASAFGASASAFLPRLAHRLAVPPGSPPRRACAVCARPFLSFLRAGAACPCSAGRWPGVTLLGAACSGLLAAALGPSPLLPALLPAAVLGVLLSLIDIRCLRLPDALVAALALLLLAGRVWLGVTPPDLLPAVLAGGLAGSAYLAVALLPGEGLGLGDVKLATVLAVFLASLGWRAWAIGMIVPHLLNGPIAAVMLLRNGRRALPFGPALLAGALAGVILTA